MEIAEKNEQFSFSSIGKLLLEDVIRGACNQNPVAKLKIEKLLAEDLSKNLSADESITLLAEGEVDKWLRSLPFELDDGDSCLKLAPAYSCKDTTRAAKVYTDQIRVDFTVPRNSFCARLLAMLINKGGRFGNLRLQKPGKNFNNFNVFCGCCSRFRFSKKRKEDHRKTVLFNQRLNELDQRWKDPSEILKANLDKAELHLTEDQGGCSPPATDLTGCAPSEYIDAVSVQSMTSAQSGFTDTSAATSCMAFNPTLHMHQRMLERGISPEDVRRTKKHGTVYRQPDGSRLFTDEKTGGTVVTRRNHMGIKVDLTTWVAPSSVMMSSLHPSSLRRSAASQKTSQGPVSKGLPAATNAPATADHTRPTATVATSSSAVGSGIHASSRPVELSFLAGSGARDTLSAAQPNASEVITVPHELCRNPEFVGRLERVSGARVVQGARDAASINLEVHGSAPAIRNAKLYVKYSGFLWGPKEQRGALDPEDTTADCDVISLTPKVAKALRVNLKLELHEVQTKHNVLVYLDRETHKLAIFGRQGKDRAEAEVAIRERIKRTFGPAYDKQLRAAQDRSLKYEFAQVWALPREVPAPPEVRARAPVRSEGGDDALPREPASSALRHSCAAESPRGNGEGGGEGGGGEGSERRSEVTLTRAVLQGSAMERGVGAGAGADNRHTRVGTRGGEIPTIVAGIESHIAGKQVVVPQPQQPSLGIDGGVSQTRGHDDDPQKESQDVRRLDKGLGAVGDSSGSSGARRYGGTEGTQGQSQGARQFNQGQSQGARQFNQGQSQGARQLNEGRAVVGAEDDCHEPWVREAGTRRQPPEVERPQEVQVAVRRAMKGLDGDGGLGEDEEPVGLLGVGETGEPVDLGGRMRACGPWEDCETSLAAPTRVLAIAAVAPMTAAAAARAADPADAAAGKGEKEAVRQGGLRGETGSPCNGLEDHVECELRARTAAEPPWISGGRRPMPHDQDGVPAPSGAAPHVVPDAHLEGGASQLAPLDPDGVLAPLDPDGVLAPLDPDGVLERAQEDPGPSTRGSQPRGGSSLTEVSDDASDWCELIERLMPQTAAEAEVDPGAYCAAAGRSGWEDVCEEVALLRHELRAERIRRVQLEATSNEQGILIRDLMRQMAEMDKNIKCMRQMMYSTQGKREEM
ncbi:hypothetical protein CYMTET_49734 [Cymbomonas tetramitiformis]|uniref:Uncharacterized protein n=1 Tax=Cymbomonas tetramitiformis TaxID=36881 RepID=A0AAE0EVH5_9CHLO|nr:hypothetical protein CYMTET_49734 [Cymbomonas tetramitiformis]